MIATAAVALVMAVVLVGINAASYFSIASSVDGMLEMIVENGGTLPVVEKPDKSEKQDKQAPGMPFSSRYFTVYTDETGAAYGWELGNANMVDEQQAAEWAQEILQSGGSGGFFVVYRYRVAETESGKMVVFLECARELNSFYEFLRSSAIVGAAALLAVFVMLVLFSGRAIKPIADSYQRQRRFITDASHELKTPLTVIGASAEVLEMTGGENQWTESIKNQVERLSEMTAKLVALSRMDEEAVKPLMSDFSLSDAVMESAGQFAAMAQSRGKQLQLSVEKNVTLFGDDGSIRQLTAILIENALKYAPEGSAVEVRLKTKGRSKVLTVKNQAPDMKKGRHEELFERFYRTDASRSSETGGFGIGLSIAKAITLAHKGKIAALSEEDGILTVTVTL